MCTPPTPYTPHTQPLVEAYQACRNLGNVLRLELFETWTRPYQVLPLRTHPTMLMNSNSGFVLTGIKVADGPRALAPTDDTAKRPRVAR